MEYAKFDNKYFLRMDKGEEIVSTLKEFCKEKNIKLGWVKGIGAINQVQLGLFQAEEKDYITKEFQGDFEITSLLGNISTKDGEVYLHLHMNLSDDEYKTYGGHLDWAVISATGELFIEEVEGSLERKFDENVGLNLYKFE